VRPGLLDDGLGAAAIAAADREFTPIGAPLLQPVLASSPAQSTMRSSPVSSCLPLALSGRAASIAAASRLAGWMCPPSRAIRSTVIWAKRSKA
jgi:hypothetical protein